MDFIEFMDNVCEGNDTNNCGFDNSIKLIISKLPCWDRNRYHLLTKTYNPTVEKEIEQRNSGKSPDPNSTLMAEKDVRIKELEEQLAERDCKISELKERLAEMEVDWENAEDIEKTTPKTVQMFFIKQLLDIVLIKKHDISKRDLVLLSSLLCNYEKPKSVYTHPSPWNNDFVFKTMNEKYKIFDISAVLIHGIGLNDASLKDRVMEICGKIPEDEDYVKLVTQLLPTK